MSPLVSLICPICLPPDAISQAALWKLELLQRWKLLGKIRDVCLFTYNSNVRHPAIKVIQSVEALLTDRYFCASEVAIHEFGVYNDLLNTVFLRSAPQRTLVQYHNITPEHLVRNQAHRSNVRRGLSQRANLYHVDHIFADSSFNRRELIEFGIAPEKISVVPLPLTRGFPPGPIRVRREIGEARILFVGRFVPAKGMCDLLEAVRELHHGRLASLRLRLVGDLTYCDPDYLRSLREMITEFGLDGVVTLVGSVGHEQLVHEYQAADIFAIPSHHEGFCVPVLEALSCGCMVVGYDAGNLPSITAGLGRLVPCGNRRGLASALAGSIEMLRAAISDPEHRRLELDGGTLSIGEFEQRAAQHVSSFSDQACASLFWNSLRRCAWPYLQRV
jgi:glycosyltransferase involved in cell wall biosynthesis